mgnify:CR=1 FL=1
MLAEDGNTFTAALPKMIIFPRKPYTTDLFIFQKNCIVNELSLLSNEPTHLPLSLEDHFNESLFDLRYYSKCYIDCTYQMDKNGLITKMDQLYLP